MLINIIFDYYADIVSVPDYIGIDLLNFQNKCDKWLFDKTNEHEFWEKDASGKKLGVGICSEAFIYWINKFILKDSEEKAYIVKRNINVKNNYPSIYY